MTYNAFLYPEILQDTPRLFTAIAEWLAIFIYFFVFNRRLKGAKFVSACVISFAIIAGFQYLAGILSIWFWIITMIGAVLLMAASLFIVLDAKPLEIGVITVHAFVLAEFAASLYRQLYVWITLLSGKDVFPVSLLMMAVTYGIIYSSYFLFQKRSYRNDISFAITRKDFIGALATGIGVFFMSNISFVWSTTPFSDTGNLLYVRTLVDFGGIMILLTQLGRAYEMAIRTESDAISKLFYKQYEQYKLAVDNSELLRKEIHDMKHYVMALKDEDDPERRAEVLADMELTIAVQEAFMNTGNQVLDVILTTKSLQCENKGITLNAMVDGDILTNIHVKDLCSLFGNILDNAIEATQLVEDTEKRLITLNVHKKNSFIVVTCENYSENHLGAIGNLPSTTKKDKIHHGYGLKSIKQVAEKYGGAMTISENDGWFCVKVLLNA